MVVECNHCHTKYNIDEKKIPVGGVRVRCKNCGDVMYIRKSAPPGEEKVPGLLTDDAGAKAPALAEGSTPPPPTVEKPPSLMLPKKAEAERKAVEESVQRKAHLSEEHVSEEDKKWHARARRLAKALASDLVLYNKARVEQGLREGNIAQILGPEIRRSWEYYCQQIPKHIVEQTDYFKEQLNTIVGRGKKIFK
jgi:predicted Zn finger-like uncharacterized protein